MTLAQCKKIAPDPLLAIATTCLGVAATTVTVGMYVGATSTSTPPLAIPKPASVPVEPPSPKLFATIPATNLAATAPAKLAAKLVEPTSPAKRTPQVQKGRPDPFAPLFSEEQTQPEEPVPQPLPPSPAPAQLELQPPPTTEIRQVTQYAARIVLKGASEAEDGKSALVQLPGEPSPRFVNEGEVVKVGRGEVRFARIEDVDSSSPRIILEENGVEVVRALGQRPTKRNSSESQVVASNSVPKLHLQNPTTETRRPDSTTIVPVPSLPPVSKNPTGGDRLPSPPPLSDANKTIRQKENNQLPALKPSKLGQQMVKKTVVAARSLPPAGVVTPARQERVKLLSKLRQPRPRPVSIQERQQHLQQHPPFLLPVSNSTSFSARTRGGTLETSNKPPQFQERRLMERQQLVRLLKQKNSSPRQPTPTPVPEERASKGWEQWQKIAGVDLRK